MISTLAASLLPPFAAHAVSDSAPAKPAAGDNRSLTARHRFLLFQASSG
jgi:hypothetical protein